MKPRKEDFALSKMKLKNGGGMGTSYKVDEIVGEESRTAWYNVEVGDNVHPDLLDALNALRPIVSDVFGFNDEQAEKIDVRGVSWSGEGAREGVVVTCTFETVNGQKVALNTPRIVLSACSYGFEEEFVSLLNVVIDEAYEYLFNGKQAQLSLFGGEPEGNEAEE